MVRSRCEVVVMMMMESSARIGVEQKRKARIKYPSYASIITTITTVKRVTIIALTDNRGSLPLFLVLYALCCRINCCVSSLPLRTPSMLLLALGAQHQPQVKRGVVLWFSSYQFYVLRFSVILYRMIKYEKERNKNKRHSMQKINI